MCIVFKAGIESSPIESPDQQGLPLMNDTSSFSRIAQSPQRLYGPRKLLVCGFTKDGQMLLEKVLHSTAIQDMPVIYATTPDLELTLTDLLSRQGDLGGDEASRMPAAIIMAGISEKELHDLMSSYRQAGLPNPLWATLTPISEGWTLRELLQELSAERAALEKQPPPAGPGE